MKIKTKEMSYADVMALPREKRIKPIKQTSFWRKVMKTASASELKSVNFTYTSFGMEKLGEDESAIFLMNHSSFIDLGIASTILADRQFHIICTNDGFIGKAGLMQRLGCIPAKKFIGDVNMVKDMKYVCDKLGSSILMYPEASYSFDGTETPLPDSLGKCLKILNVPVVMIKTKGAFLRDPLYNCLQKRNVDVTATVEYLLSPEDIQNMTVHELNQKLAKTFTYNHFKEQTEERIEVDEPFRADGLHRVLYKCPCCNTEGKMIGKGITIRCQNCNAEYELTSSGELCRLDEGEISVLGNITSIPDWYRWERECVKKEVEESTYKMVLDVDIMMLVDLKCIYKVGEGTLVHDSNGFMLTGCEGELNYTQTPKASYSLYSDYYWYEIGDMICIGDTTKQFYCFPKNQEEAIVAKARLAAEEMYKL